MEVRSQISSMYLSHRSTIHSLVFGYSEIAVIYRPRQLLLPRLDVYQLQQPGECAKTPSPVLLLVEKGLWPAQKSQHAESG